MKKIIFSLSIFAFALNAFSQKQLTLNEIWASRTFAQNNVAGFQSMADGKSYVQTDDDGIYKNINRYDFATGNKIGTIFSNKDLKINNVPLAPDNFEFSADEKKVLITNGYEQIYRHSGRTNAYVLDIATNKLTTVSNKKVMYATLSPDGSKVAYVIDNNLYYTDLNSGKEIQVTKDGIHNSIINGAVDWVYEEEFSMSKGFEWSPNGKHIAYYRFDESKVPLYSMDIYGTLYPEAETFKYPKAGEANSDVNVFIYDLEKGVSVDLKLNTATDDSYLPRIQWNNLGKKTPSYNLMIQKLNRTQNTWTLLSYNLNSARLSEQSTEKNKYYVDVKEKLIVSGSALYYTSEQDGFNRIWSAQINEGNPPMIVMPNEVLFSGIEIDELLGYDEVSKTFYFTSPGTNPSDRQLYSYNLKKKKVVQLTNTPGWHNIYFSEGFHYYLDAYSTIDMPYSYSICNNTGKQLRVLEDNKALNETLTSYNLSKPEFGSFTSSENVKLDYYIIKPKDFDPAKKYPVLFNVYGGPGYQTVKNSWGGANYLWHQMMAQKGYIIISVDNRGSGGRGEEFKKMTYLQLGKYETTDYIEAAKYFGAQSYVDKNRIGIWGWSYGGFMASSCITKGADYFKTAVAVAPVTNWRYYDNIYTERYMRTPAENASGYDLNSPINHVNEIKGNYLLIHGTADDNVHFQNAVEMVKAMNDNNIAYDAEYYPNKNHGISGGKTRLHLFTKITKYLEQNL